ncbi:MAG: YqgE/AlgH family protein [Bryobacteraceae bacterium]
MPIVRPFRFLRCHLALLVFAVGLAGQSTADPRDLATGRFLIAVRDLPDPNFAETVILLTDFGEKGAAGLVLTRRTRLTISDLFEDKAAARAEDPVWRGGPVQRSAVLALFRGKTAPEGSQPVAREIHLLTTRESLERALSEPAGRVKVFLGYSGWGAGQLEREVELGTWHILNGDVDAVFAADVSSLWERLARRMERRIAFAPVGRGESGSNQGATASD